MGFASALAALAGTDNVKQCRRFAELAADTGHIARIID
jgi:hypothetical protein